TCPLCAISGHTCRGVNPCSSPHCKSDHRPSCIRQSSQAACPCQGAATSRWSLLSFPRWHSFDRTEHRACPQGLSAVCPYSSKVSLLRCRPKRWRTTHKDLDP